MTITTNKEVKLTVNCKAFFGEGVRSNKVAVDSDGTIRVWDSTAGHYTTCHSLGRDAQRRIRKIASGK